MKYSVPSKLSSDCITTYFIDRELLDGFFFQQAKHFVSSLWRTTGSLVSQKLSSTSYEVFIHVFSQISLHYVLKQRALFLLAQANYSCKCKELFMGTGNAWAELPGVSDPSLTSQVINQKLPDSKKNKIAHLTVEQGSILVLLCCNRGNWRDADFQGNF